MSEFDFNNPQRKQRQIASNILNSYSDLSKAESIDLEKGGEGSKGGKVIGHTKSGKPIYDSYTHKEHKHFTKEDHKDAWEAQNNERTKFRDKLAHEHSGGNFKTERELRSHLGIGSEKDREFVKKLQEHEDVDDNYIKHSSKHYNKYERMMKDEERAKSTEYASEEKMKQIKEGTVRR